MLIGTLADILQIAVDKVGKIRVIDDRQVCDLNQALAFHSNCQLMGADRSYTRRSNSSSFFFFPGW
jgi:hypothetical protein